MTYTMKDLGCYFDGAYGFEYNAQRLLEFASNSHGYTPEDIDSEDIDAIVWEMDDVTHYLNDNTERPPNTYWNWEDGDFGLWLYCESCGEIIDEDYACCKEE